MNIEVILYGLKRYSDELHSAYLKVRYDIEKIKSVRESLRTIEDDSMRVVRSKLKYKIEELEQTLSNLKKLKVGLDKIIETYERCEDRIVDYGEENEVRILWQMEMLDFRVEPIKPAFYYATDGIDVKLTEPV